MSEFSRCRGLFGFCSMDIHQVLELVSKKYSSVCIARDQDFDFSDVIIVETVKTLLTIRNQIHKDMIVCVVDSAVNLLSVQNMLPVDFLGEPFSDGFQIIKAASLHKPIETEIQEISGYNPLRSLLALVATYSFLTIYNKVSSVLNPPARKTMRQLITKAFITGDLTDLMDFLSGLKVPYYDEFEAIFSVKNLKKLTEAIAAYQNGGSLSEISNRYRLDSYDITFLDKLLRKENVILTLSK